MAFDAEDWRSNLPYYNWTFRQNNSFGYYIGPTSFTVTARSMEDAFVALKNQPWYTDVYDCDCCGPRWHTWNVEQSSEVI